MSHTDIKERLIRLSSAQIDLESVFALNPDVAPDEEIPQSPEAPPSNIGKTSKLPKVLFSHADYYTATRDSLMSFPLSFFTAKKL